MSKGGYKIFDQGGMYFVSFAVVSWIDPPNGGQVCLHEKNIEMEAGYCRKSQRIYLWQRKRNTPKESFDLLSKLRDSATF